MKKNVWIMNHYAGNQFFEKGGRHYSFAKYLKKNEYNPVVFCSNASHQKIGYFFDSDKLTIIKHDKEIDVPFVFVKSRKYVGNGIQRILNMVDFFINVQKSAEAYARKFGNPSVILASSVHPLTLLAGIKLAQKFCVKCICEIRDLWPESLVAYGILKKDSLLARLLYAGEKWIYKKAYKVIMTWPGGYDYIRDKEWDKDIPLDKVVHISNGVDLEEYHKNMMDHPYYDSAFSECKSIRITYTGSIRKVNNLGLLIKSVEILKNRGIDDFKLFIFGDGEERNVLEKTAKEKKLDAITFMGKIPKGEIPSVLSQSDINILHNSSTSLDKYGQSQNKFFEYLAAGRPILMTYSVGHSVVKKEHCGIEVEHQNPELVANAIQEICTLSKDTIEKYSENAKESANKYDFKFLTNEVISLIETI